MPRSGHEPVALHPLLTPWEAILRPLSDRRATAPGQAAALRRLVDNIPPLVPSSLSLSGDCVRVGCHTDAAPDTLARLAAILTGLRPWRKGPFQIFGIDVDAEWRSDWKWRRVKPFIRPLEDRRVLDVGSSSGYYMFRMLPDNPAMVLGIEPFPAYYYQYRLLQSFVRSDRLCGLPLTFEDLPEMTGLFDTVFLMGILYHVRRPLDMLARIRRFMAPGGQLVLESLVLEENGETVLTPAGRYAKMRNVYAVPSVPSLKGWLKEAGFYNTRCVDISRTLPAEQRRTDWMPFASLNDFLDAKDPSRTVEGLPAPVRAVVIAESR